MEISVMVNEAVGTCPGHNYEHGQFKNLPKSNTFFFCTIEEARLLQDRMLGVVSYSRSAFNVHEWLPVIGTNAMNWKGSYYLHSGQLSGREIGMFCRSDGGDKQWPGQMIKDALDIALIQDRTLVDEMLFVAPAVPIECEWRCWMTGGKCAEAVRYVNPFCEYAVNGMAPGIVGVKRYAEWLDDELHQPDDMYVVDIALTHDGLKVVEYNSYSTSGWYGADAEKLVKATVDYLSN